MKGLTAERQIAKAQVLALEFYAKSLIFVFFLLSLLKTDTQQEQ